MVRRFPVAITSASMSRWWATSYHYHYHHHHYHHHTGDGPCLPPRWLSLQRRHDWLTECYKETLFKYETLKTQTESVCLFSSDIFKATCYPEVRQSFDKQRISLSVLETRSPSLLLPSINSQLSASQSSQWVQTSSFIIITISCDVTAGEYSSRTSESFEQKIALDNLDILTDNIDIFTPRHCCHC